MKSRRSRSLPFLRVALSRALLSTGRRGGLGLLARSWLPTKGAARRSAEVRRGVGRGSRGPIRGRARLSGTLRVVLVMVALVMVNLYVLYYRHGTSVPALLQAAEAGRQASLLPGLSGPTGTPPQVQRSRHGQRDEGLRRDYCKVVEVALAEDDTLEGVLRRQGLGQKVGADLAGALRPEFQAGQAGAKLDFYYDLEGQVAAVDYQREQALGFRLERVVTGSAERWSCTRQEGELSRRAVVVNVVVPRGATLGEAVQRAGEGRALGGLLGEVFAYDLDLPQVVHEGDRLRVVVEKVYRGAGFYRYGRVLAAQYEGSGVVQRAFYYESQGQPGAYYSEAGEPLARGLRRTPLRQQRVQAVVDREARSAAVSDRRRSSPGLHLERGRVVGADFPAPIGTPVQALAAGTLSALSQSRRSGGLLVVAHAGGVETQYGNLLHFARGLVEGQSVYAGQVIGYVGAWPLAAKRSHLHLGVRVAGKLVDPLRFRPVVESAVARPALMKVIAGLRERLEPAALARTP